jgi:hypothetical protein
VKQQEEELCGKMQRAWDRRQIALLVATLGLVAVVVLRGISIGEFHYNVDEAQQAVTGLFFADFLRDLPLSDPVQYAYRYYAQYPALGLVHWPPFFHFAEGMAFLLLGPSAVSGRLTVLLFGLVGLFFWYRLVRELQNDWTAAVSTVLLAFLPTVLLFEKLVMLEMPAMAMCMGATYFWVRYLRENSGWSLAWFTLLASLALLTKQHTLYLALFCLFTILGLGHWRRLGSWKLIAAFLVTVLLTGPFYWLAFRLHSVTIVQDTLHVLRPGDISLWEYWQLFPKMLPNQLGTVLLVLSLLGIATCWRTGRRETTVVMLGWIGSCYVALTLIAFPESRQAMFWLPPFVYFAAIPLTTGWLPPRVVPVAAVLAVGLVGISTVRAWQYQRPYISGYEKVATQIIGSSKSPFVLFDGEVPGNFVFYMRAHDPERRFYVLRKALYSTRIIRGHGEAELVQSKEDIQELINAYGIEHIVVLNDIPLHFESQRMLREMLAEPPYVLVGKTEIETNDRQWKGRYLLHFRNSQPTAPSAKELRLKMLTLDSDIVVTLDNRPKK